MKSTYNVPGSSPGPEDAKKKKTSLPNLPQVTSLHSNVESDIKQD